ncbi:MAG: CU044_5270 family protein, partial [Pseudonocardia sp.]|nr:CU044_5270 family protein [Pseudonocardia sp.]
SIIVGGAAPGDAGVGRPPETLVAVMQRAAAAVDLESGPGSLAPGQFWYTRDRTYFDGGIQEEYSTPPCTEDEWWWGVDGPQRTVTRECADSGEGPIIEQQDFSTSIPEPDPAAMQLEPDAVPPSEPDIDLRTLPTDPSALLDRITREAENAPDEGKTLAEEQFIRAVTLLSDPDAPPTLRSAVFQVMPQIDGVRLLGPSTDGLGRRGVAIAGSIGFGQRTELIIEPDVGRVLGERTVVTDNDPARDRVSHITSHVVAGVVTSTDQRL